MFVYRIFFLYCIFSLLSWCCYCLCLPFVLSIFHPLFLHIFFISVHLSKFSFLLRQSFLSIACLHFFHSHSLFFKVKIFICLLEWLYSLIFRFTYILLFLVSSFLLFHFHRYLSTFSYSWFSNFLSSSFFMFSSLVFMALYYQHSIPSIFLLSSVPTISFHLLWCLCFI